MVNRKRVTMSLIKHFIAVALLVLTSQGVFASLLMTPNVDPDLVYQGTILEGNYTGDTTKPSVFLRSKRRGRFV